MAKHLLCDEVPVNQCAPIFRLVASAWIDATNFGPHEVGSDPPAGIRLRWNCPFVSGPPSERLGKPVRFIVERAGPFNPAGGRWLSFKPRVGHESRSPTPAELWRPLPALDDRLTFRALGDDCDGVDAIAFTMPNAVDRMKVTLVDVNGSAQVVAEIGPGDDFHYEWANLKLVVFSGPPGPVQVIGRSIAHTLEGVEFHPIAELAADIWPRLPLAKAAERVTNSAGHAFLTISDGDWNEFCGAGRKLDDYLDNGTEVDPEIEAAISLMAATRFEAAALIGWGFVDGEHVAAPKLDHIQGPLLSTPDDSIYAYRISAVVRRNGLSEHRETSAVAFTKSSQAPMLTDATCSLIERPISRAELANYVRPGPEPTKPDRYAPPEDRVVCRGTWRVQYDLPGVEFAATRPVAEDSAITKVGFVDRGYQFSGFNRPPKEVRGNRAIEPREHRFEVPYFDSDVGCEVEAGDFWDRRLKGPAAHLTPPRVEYRGEAAPIETATCIATSRGAATLTVALAKVPEWKPDSLAKWAGAELAFYMRRLDPEFAPEEEDVEAGPPSPTKDGQWSADVRTMKAKGDLEKFVGGMLAIGPLAIRVSAIGPIRGGLARCTFDVIAVCGGAELYVCEKGWLQARLVEDALSIRLWRRFDKSMKVLRSGELQAPTDLWIPERPEASTTLFFSTRLELTFEEQRLYSSLSAPVAAPYLHPAPPKPEACLSISQLTTDYYGRVLIRAEASNCHPIDPEYSQKIAVASEDLVLSDPQDTTKAFLARKSEGMFGAQTLFDRRVLYDAFTGLGSISEGDRYIVGLTTVRSADGRESPPSIVDAAPSGAGGTEPSKEILRTSTVKRIEDCQGRPD